MSAILETVFYSFFDLDKLVLAKNVLESALNFLGICEVSLLGKGQRVLVDHLVVLAIIF